MPRLRVYIVVIETAQIRTGCVNVTFTALHGNVSMKI